LRLNQEGIRNQLTKFLNFDCGATSAKLVNNYDWFKGIGFLEFLRDAGKHLTVNYMMSKDSVKTRMETGISFTEFSYQLLQGYDYCHLYKNNNVRLQMGGSDQWGNITTGTTFIKKMVDGAAFALTTPLLTKADGTKFGKSAGGNIWLDPSLTSPYKFYQFWLNSADEDVSRFIRIFTLLSKEEIEALEAEHTKAPHERLLQKTLAKDITIRVHSEEDYEMAIKASEILFGKSVIEDLQSLNEATLLSVFEGIPMIEASKSILDQKPTVLDLLSTLTNLEVFPSKGEARKMIQGGGVSINKIKINSSEEIVNYPLLLDSYLLVQKGRRNYYILRFN
jgi:tyrosyl-tRNA synthetase